MLLDRQYGVVGEAAVRLRSLEHAPRWPLCVLIQNCKHLVGTGDLDAYASIKFFCRDGSSKVGAKKAALFEARECRWRSKALRGPHPVWNAECSVLLPPSCVTMLIEVWDERMFGDTLLGGVRWVIQDESRSLEELAGMLPLAVDDGNLATPEGLALGGITGEGFVSPPTISFMLANNVGEAKRQLSVERRAKSMPTRMPLQNPQPKTHIPPVKKTVFVAGKALFATRVDERVVGGSGRGSMAGSGLWSEEEEAPN